MCSLLQLDLMQFKCTKFRNGEVPSRTMYILIVKISYYSLHIERNLTEMYSQYILSTKHNRITLSNVQTNTYSYTTGREYRRE